MCFTIKNLRYIFQSFICAMQMLFGWMFCFINTSSKVDNLGYGQDEVKKIHLGIQTKIKTFFCSCVHQKTYSPLSSMSPTCPSHDQKPCWQKGIYNSFQTNLTKKIANSMYFNSNSMWVNCTTLYYPKSCSPCTPNLAKNFSL